MASKNEIKFAVGCDSTVRNLVEAAFIAGCDKARWFRPDRPITYMDMAEAAAKEYAEATVPRRTNHE